MKVKSRKMPSVYDDSHFRRRDGWTNVMIFSLLLLLALALVRFGNLTLMWHMNRLELQNKPVSDGDYHYLGLSGDRKAAGELSKQAGLNRQPVTVVAYYTMARPAKFLIHNRDSARMLDLGRLVVYACSGGSEVTLYPTGMIRQECQDREYACYFEAPLLAKVIQAVAGSDSGVNKPSFILKSLAQTGYLKIPYLLYFYVPLVLIVLLTLRFGPGFLIAAFYYVEIFLLFDFRQVMVEVPFSWVLKGVGLEFGEGLAWGMAAGWTALAVAAAVAGIFGWRQLKAEKWGVWFLFLILLLPLVLRF